MADTEIVGFIQVDPGELPSCPFCLKTDWTVKQRIERESALIRADRFCDLVVAVPDRDTYIQSLVLRCNSCQSIYQPQAGIWGRTEAYSEGTQEVGPNEVGDPVIVTEKLTGLEDGFAFPGQVGNDAEWVA